MTTTDLFSEDSLRATVVERWGEHGAHVDVLDELIRRARLPCHHWCIQEIGDAIQDFVCVETVGHRGDHRDDEDRQWPNETCDTDLHEGMRPVLRFEEEDEGLVRSLCGQCAARLALHAKALLLHTKRERDEAVAEAERLRERLSTDGS